MKTPLNIPPLPRPPQAVAGQALPSPDDMLARILAAARALGGNATGAITVRIESAVDPDGDGLLPPVKGSVGFSVILRRGALSVQFEQPSVSLDV